MHIHRVARRTTSQHPRQDFMSFWVRDRLSLCSSSSFLIFELFKSRLALFGSSIDDLFFEAEHASL